MRRVLVTAVVLLGVTGAVARGDVFRGTAGPDRFAVAYNDRVDHVTCGAGADIVNADLEDIVAADCETVARRLSRDATTAPRAQHETQVEPAAASNGTTVVTLVQDGRYEDSGAAAIGWSTSTDAGGSWRSGTLPGLDYPKVSDPVLVWDAAHHVFLAGTLALTGKQVILVASRSRDGLGWSAPVVAAGDTTEDPDKEWIACDTWATSRFYGRCYLAYLDFRGRRVALRTTDDGGLTWSKSVAAVYPIPDAAIVNGAQPVVRPDGSLTILYAVFATIDVHGDHIAAVRSTDGGATFVQPATVAEIENEDIAGLRESPLPSAAVDGAGTIWVAWSDCRFREQCVSDDIVVAASRDGKTWTPPARVPIVPERSRVNVFLPALAAGAAGRVALTYYTQPDSPGCFGLIPCAGVDAGAISTVNGAGTWTKAQRLTAQSMLLPWIAAGDEERMLGDYIATTYARGKPVSVFPVAGAPIGEEGLRQALFGFTSR